jgi:hypothetical protein
VVLGASAFAAKRIVLLPDAAERDGLRQLRVWLRWRGTHGSGSRA